MNHMDEALARIRQEAERQTGSLDLRGLVLNALPEQMFTLTHLQGLYLGRDDDGHGHAPIEGYGNRFRIFRELQRLWVEGCTVIDLAFVRALPQLQELNCSGTSVSGLAQLQELSFSFTSVSDLSPLSGLAQLRKLDCSYCSLTDLPEALVRSPTLQDLQLDGVTLPNWPPVGVLSRHPIDNCLPRVRAHLDDLAAGEAVDLRVKLLILGNGGAGKTQIAKWLADAAYRLNPDWDSTHGICVQRAAMGGEPELTLSIWDFGGQDIYHGVHALFLNSPALLLLVWAKDTEVRGGHGDADLWFRDHPLPYWLALARQQAHDHSPLLLAQSKCDQPEDRVSPFPLDDAMLTGLPYAPPRLYLSVGARTGRDTLCEEVRIAAGWLRNPTRMGVPRVGKGRLRVRDRMEELRAQGLRLLPMADFQALCTELGGVNAPEHLLTWLDAEGVVFHRPGLFQDQVVLDPSWALEAIYAIFDRQSGLVKRIRRQRGRFSRDLLSDSLWRDYSRDEQDVFLSMMVSCGICFVLRQWQEDGAWLREYVAPDLLPERAAVVGVVPVRWSADAPQQQAAYTYPVLHGGLIRTILAQIGRMAGEDALYWRGGLCGYETGYRSRFMIEQEMAEQEITGAWSGRIVLRTQDGDAGGLLARLQQIVEHAAAMIGLRGERQTPQAPRRPEPTEPTAAEPLRMGADPLPVQEWYVSYAWNDADNPTLEQPVDDLCAAAAKRGIRIVRDRTDLGPSDGRITAFMDKIGAGQRIVVVLSEKYLRSPFCMHELHAIWRRSRTDAEFIGRVRLWALPSVPIWTPKQRVAWNQHWYKEYTDLSGCLQPGEPPSLLGEDGMRRLLLMQEFFTKAADILGTLADHVHKRDWAEFLEYVFADAD